MITGVPDHDHLLRLAVEAARAAREHGNHPFGAVLADAAGIVLLTAENTVVTDRDPSAHAETNAVRAAGVRFDAATLRSATLYASTEPWAMCGGAIFWAGIGAVGYALAATELDGFAGAEPGLALTGRDVLASGRPGVVVTGPTEVPGAREVHDDFWS